MIKYETIISNFDDKTTLYNWLRKVEEALKHASATNFVVNKKGNATLSFSITFADGTTLESGDIVLQQGESVDDARIASGILQLHLTNGTWLTAGNIKPVNNFSINASQHLIVNYQDGTSQDLGAIFQGNVNISGNITATGTIDGNKITGNEIVEKMSDYQFHRIYSDANLTYNYLFAGVVKTGNKISFVINADVTRTDDTPGNNVPMGNFTIPVDICNKLFPDENGWLSFNQIYCATSYNAGVNLPALVIKDSGEYKVIFRLYKASELTLNTKYNIRFEVTFLLCDNMAE